MAQDAELRSRAMMRAFELLSKRIGVDESVLVRWFEGRAELPASIMRRLAEEASETSPVYYEVVDDPLQTEHGQQVFNQLVHVSKLLERYVEWRAAVGCMRVGEGWCLINRFGEPISHCTEDPVSLRAILAWSRLNPPISLNACP